MILVFQKVHLKSVWMFFTIFISKTKKNVNLEFCSGSLLLCAIMLYFTKFTVIGKQNQKIFVYCKLYIETCVSHKEQRRFYSIMFKQCEAILRYENDWVKIGKNLFDRTKNAKIYDLKRQTIFKQRLAVWSLSQLAVCLKDINGG